ncbi:MAG: hypothetical protein EOO05_18160 [Chitinophagaceae bacterium]|nr:MAG: hypothetical protein EOO05_18160 [Chitinophagaceae bacterium]
MKISVDYSHYWLAKINTAALLDLTAVIRVGKRFTLSPLLHNVLNEKTIGYESLTPVSFNSYRFHLISRYLLLKVSLDF